MDEFVVANGVEHVPTEASRQLVESLVACGTTEDMIARLVRMDPKTLRKHYREELDLGTARANFTIAGKLFEAATKLGSVAAMIFWLKARAKWSERVDFNATGEIKHTGEVTALVLPENLEAMSVDELTALYRSKVAAGAGAKLQS